MRSKAPTASVNKPWSWDAVAASAWENLPPLLKRLSERPVSWALLDELKALAAEIEGSKKEDAVDTAWGAPAVEPSIDNPHSQPQVSSLEQARM